MAATNTLGTITRSFTWDTCPNGIGRLCSAVHVNDDTIGYSYTPEGWIAARNFSFVSGINYALGYSYDNMGHLASVTYPDGNQALYDYTRGAVADVRLQIGSASSYAATSVVYRPMDLAMSGWTSNNGLTNTIAYDSDLRPTSISAVVSLAFSYDLANHIIGITNRFHAPLTQSFTYDAMGRIATIASGVDNESFIYDADGNRIQHIANGFTEISSYPATSNHLARADATVYGYDADGNVTTINGHVLYGYSAMGRLADGNGGIYAIAAEGQRLRKTVAPDQTYFAPDRSGVLLAEDLSGTWQDYVYLAGRLVAVVKAGQVYSAHGDQTGRTLMLTNSVRVPVWMATGLPFGSTVTTNTFGAFNLGYPGQYFDAEDGFWYNGYRGYMPWIGRYSQSDPLGLAGGINTYAYAGNNPIENIDPTGSICWRQLAQRIGLFAVGSLGVTGGIYEGVGGAAGAIFGVGTLDAPMAAVGAFGLGDGAVNIVDGGRAMASAIDGKPRGPVLADVDREIGGQSGARIGGIASDGLSIVSVARSLGGLFSHGGAGNALDAASATSQTLNGTMQLSSNQPCGCQ